MGQARWNRSLAALLLAAAQTGAAATTVDAAARERAVEAHVAAIEAIGRQPAAESLSQLEARHFVDGLVAGSARATMLASIEALRPVIAGAAMIRLDARDGGFVFGLRGARNANVVFAVEDRPPYRIRRFEIDDNPAPEPMPAAPALTWAALPAALGQAEREGFAGFVLALKGGEAVLSRGFGTLDRGGAKRPSQDTVFDIGSMPIDFTRALILALEQQGRLAMGDHIGSLFDRVPADKQAITLAQLMDGRSGLANFHFRDGDADKDLSWIPRDLALRRIFEMPLLFPPGTGQSHSHSAFGLLAAVAERVTGKTYGALLQELLFEPAAMKRTGFYGQTLGLPDTEFAVGDGRPAATPNIPPRWGPASWLVLGSGGMVASVADMQRAHAYLSSGRLLTGDRLQRYRAARLGVGGSERGFFFLRVIGDDGDALFLASNAQPDEPSFDRLVRSLVQLLLPGHEGGPGR